MQKLGSERSIAGFQRNDGCEIFFDKLLEDLQSLLFRKRVVDQPFMCFFQDEIRNSERGLIRMVKLFGKQRLRSTTPFIKQENPGGSIDKNHFFIFPAKS